MFYRGQNTIDGSSNSNKIHIFPNPSHNQLNIDGEFETWVLTDSKGVLIKEGSNKLIDVKFLSPGIYLLKVDGEMKKFVKN